MNLKLKHGAPLYKAGYALIPIKAGEKHPFTRGWTEIKATEDSVVKWIKSSYYGGFGILGKNTPGIDIDVYDADIVDKLVKWCHDNLGAAPVRRGNAPRALIPCSPPKDGLGPDYSAIYTGPDKQKHQIEIKATGQQWVAYGVHPKTEKEYAWEGGELYDFEPDWLPELTGDKINKLFNYFYSIVPENWELKSKGKREKQGGVDTDGKLTGATAFENYVPPINIEVSRLKDMLSYLDPDGQVNGLGWRTVGMALYHQFEGSDEGLEIFDEWSRRSVEYNREEIEARWPSWKAGTYSGKPVTAATIVKMYNTVMDESDDVTLRRKPDNLKDWEKRFVIVEQPDGTEVHDAGVPIYRSPKRSLKAFKEHNAGYLHRYLTPDGSVKTRPMVDSWAASLNTHHYAGYTYQPGKERFCPKEHAYGDDSLYVNSFYFPPHEKIDSEKARKKIQVFLDFLEHLFPEKIEKEWVIQWLARIIKNPGVRSFVTPINITSCTGTGRGILFDILLKLFGSHNCHDVAKDDLEGRFNGFIDKCIIAVVQEIKTATGERKYQMWERMKSLLADTTTNVHQKYKDPYTATVYANFLMFSNNLDALPIPNQGERRIYAMRGATTPPSNTDIDKIVSWKKDNSNIAALFWWLKNQEVDLSLFKRAPMSETKKQMILLSSGADYNDLNSWLDTEAPEVFDYDYASEALERFSDGMEGSGLSRKALRRAMADRGYHSTQIRLGDKRAYVYYHPAATKNDAEILKEKCNKKESLDFLE